MKKANRIYTLILLMLVSINVSAKFVQEVELKDGTILSGYVYKQQPGKFIVFHADKVRKDPLARYSQSDRNYTLQWSAIKYIRRAQESGDSWCFDKVTLKDGTTYMGQIEEQELGKNMTMSLDAAGGRKITLPVSALKISEKIASNIDKDLWTDREYTNKLKLTDGTVHEGLIVLQYRGNITNDCYVELMHPTGYRERIYLPDIKEYEIVLR